MRYMTYDANGKQQAGVLLENERVYGFEQILERDYTLLAFIQAYACKTLPDFQKLIKDKKIEGIPLQDVTLKAPIPYPQREIICLGKNYEDHAKEIKATAIAGFGDSKSMVPTIPIYFGKSAFPAIGSGDMIPSHQNITSQVDYEVELAVVIGKECRNIQPEQVEDHIFGYTIINDVSARDLQASHNQWYRGKGLDGFCPMGPMVVGKEEIPFPLELNISSRVNGELRQNSNTRLFIFHLPFVISQLSQGMTLYPGDIIATGTPAGVGHGFDPVRNLQPGDVVECEVEKIGVLVNKVK